ncbi:unnamed protein product [Umbelopsis sp. WA50703]
MDTIRTLLRYKLMLLLWRLDQELEHEEIGVIAERADEIIGWLAGLLINLEIENLPSSHGVPPCSHNNSGNNCPIHRMAQSISIMLFRRYLHPFSTRVLARASHPEKLLFPSNHGFPIQSMDDLYGKLILTRVLQMFSQVIDTELASHFSI